MGLETVLAPCTNITQNGSNISVKRNTINLLENKIGKI